MRLTNTIRDAFIRAAMQDVPQVDYQEQANKIAEAELDAMFEKDFPGFNRTKAGETGWLTRHGYALPRPLCRIYTYGKDDYHALERDSATWLKLQALAEKSNKQNETWLELEQKLRTAAYAVTTRKALADLLPEFEKYLPADDAVATKQNLPAVANVVADFVKAGWPKSEKKDEVAA